MVRSDDEFIVRPLKDSLTSLKTLKKRYGSLERLSSRSESRELFVFLCWGDCSGDSSIVWSSDMLPGSSYQRDFICS